MRRLIGAAAFAAAMACSEPHVEMPSAPPAAIAVRITADQPWIDTDVKVTRGERLDITATGQIFWQAHARSAGPDGIDGEPPWRLGDGGLTARVKGSTRVLEVGARTAPLPASNGRIRRQHAPAPLTMPATGTLELGFKHFTAGANTGAFEVKIWPVNQTR
jgi:hypothetical protein